MASLMMQCFMMHVLDAEQVQQPAPNGMHTLSDAPAPFSHSADSSDDEGSCESVDIQLGGSLASASPAPAEEMAINSAAESMADHAEEHASTAGTTPRAHAAGPAAEAAAAAVEPEPALQPPLEATSDAADSTNGDAPAAAQNDDSKEATAARPAVTEAATDASPAEGQAIAASSAQQLGADAATQQQSAAHDVFSSRADTPAVAPAAVDTVMRDVTFTMGAFHDAATADAAALQPQPAMADSMADGHAAGQQSHDPPSPAGRAAESDAAEPALSPQSSTEHQATPDRQQPAAPAAEAPAAPDTPVSQTPSAEGPPEDTHAEKEVSLKLTVSMRPSKCCCIVHAHVNAALAGHRCCSRSNAFIRVNPAPCMSNPAVPAEQNSPRSSTPETQWLQASVPIGLRERESRPYHMQPAEPERFSLGRRPSPSTMPPPQRADSESSWQSTSSDGEDAQQRQDTAQAERAARAAAHALWEAERQRERCVLASAWPHCSYPGRYASICSTNTPRDDAYCSQQRVLMTQEAMDESTGNQGGCSSVRCQKRLLLCMQAGSSRRCGSGWHVSRRPARRSGPSSAAAPCALEPRAMPTARLATGVAASGVRT